MREYYPVLVIAGILGLLSAIFLFAYFSIRGKKEEIGFDRHMKDSELIRRLLRYAKPYWKRYILIFTLMMLAALFDIIPPLIIGDVEEVIKGAFELREVFWRVAVYMGIVLLALGAMYLQAIMLQKVGQKILTSIREDLFLHIESLSASQLNHIPVGKLVTREANDTNAISMLFTNILVNLLKNVFVIIGVIVAMLFLNRALTLLVLAFAPFIVLFTFVFRKFSRRAYRKVKDGTTDVNTFLSENLSGIKITQIFNNEEKKLGEFREKNKRLYRAMRDELFVFSIFRPLIYMLYISSILMLLYFCGKGYIQNTTLMGEAVTSGVLVSFYMYIHTFFNPIQNLADMFNRLQSAFASAEKIFTVMDMEPEVQDSEDAIEIDHFKGEIEFRHVWFRYEDTDVTAILRGDMDEGAIEGHGGEFEETEAMQHHAPEGWILKDVSFHVKPGETVAFVGATGAGKTTILSLVCRNYDIQKGEILIDGIDIRKIKLSCLRSHFGQMLQDVFLFAGTIRSNIVLREESFTDEDVQAACRYVNADRFIDKLPKGLDEEVRERGNNFSAGQRQLLSFARTVIHKPDIMILDEATANIDTETEVLIQDSLEKMMNIGTMLIVAHRLSTIQHADRIIVINHGEIVESGNHFELLEKRGAYYKLYKLQYEAE